MTCPTCGATIADGARFCSSCGHPVGSRGDERRIATVLFADLVGFTTLSEARDPEEVKNLVDSCFERLVQDINAFGGKVDKIIGDAILALFGAPVAHEDDAERAVRAALRMQESLQLYCSETGAQIQLRIGVNTGEVLVGSLRAGAEYTAMGDVVNTAQRLQSTASPGSVVVGPATFSATRGVIDYKSLGAISAKGRDEPVDAWEAVATLLPPGYRPRRVQTPFVGREAELGILNNAIEAAVTRSRAHLVLLLGEAGVGKSRLAAEVAEHACSAHRALVYEGRCVPYGEANVWWPVAEALRQACAITPEDTATTAWDLCTDAVASALQQPADAPEVRRVVNGLIHLMGYESPLGDIDAQRAREEAHRSVLAFIDGSASRRPVVVVLSDLHWADDVVFEMIDALADRLSRSRFVLVATARQALNERWRMPTGRHNNVLVNLDPLDRGATGALLESLAEGELDAELRDALLNRSGGNPFFLEELVALVAEADVGAEVETDRQGRLTGLPDTLRGLVAARIDGLSAQERSTLEDASVWGRSGPVEALERMAEQIRSLPDISLTLAGLVDKEILVISGGRWSFRSDLIREVAYGTMTKADRARRHYGIASFLEHHMANKDDASLRAVDVIAHHYASAAELTVDIGSIEYVPETVTIQALDWLEEAANRAEMSQMPPVADRLFGQALELVDGDDGARRARLLLGRARAEASLRALDAARSMIQTVLALGEEYGEGATVARAWLALGDVQQKAGEIDDAIATFDEAVERFDHLGDRAGMAEALRQRGMTHIFSGANEEAEASISSAYELFRELDDRRGEAWALQNLAWISYVEGRADEAEGRLAESAELFEAIDDRGGLSWAQGLLGFVRYHQGRFDDAEHLAADVLVDARARGDKWGQGMMLMLTAAVRLWSGRADAAVVPADESLALFRSIGDRFGEAQAAGSLGRALITSGRVDDGFQVLNRAVEQFDARDGFGEQVVMVASMLLLSATQVGDTDRAKEVLVHLPEGGGPGLGSVEIVVGRALTRLQEGDVEGAIALLQAVGAGEGARSGFAHSALAIALAASGRANDVISVARQVDEMSGSTYLDRAVAKTAVELVRAAADDEDAVAGFTEIVANIDETEDRCAQAVVRLAEALALDSLGLPTAEWALDEAERRLDELEINASGWRTAFMLALAADKAPAGA
jgi:class 3 adenylate cyclase/tetratricopeptide (TPR) repeat protein